MNFAQYLMMPVTPLFDVVATKQPDQSYRPAVSARREAAMIRRYEGVMKGFDELPTKTIGVRVGVSKPMCGLRKLKDLGLVEMVRMSSDERGRKQCVWRWK